MKQRLFVLDASPLITLALGGALDAILAVDLPIFIPDMVYFEVTRHRDKPGSRKIFDWVKDHVENLHIVPTETFREYMILLEYDPKTRVRNRGEVSAFEVLSDHAIGDESARSFVLYEDDDVRRMRALDPELGDKVSLVSTGEFLVMVERVAHILKADDVLDLAQQNGRNVTKIAQDAARQPNPEAAELAPYLTPKG